MATWFEHLAARVAYWHAQRVFRGFERALVDVPATEQAAFQRVRRILAGGGFAARHALHQVRCPADLRRAVPLQTYEDLRPDIDRVCAGDFRALFAPGVRPVMFATSSGTTARPKRVPVTPAFVEDYRRGWNVFGLKLLTDHRDAILRDILQSSSRYDSERTDAGIPCGAITGLLARSQKRIVRRFYVGRPEIAHLPDPAARYYTLMRLGITRDVAFAITANPATLIQMARIVDEHSETLIRDVRDGTLAPAVVADEGLRATLAAPLRPDPTRAAELTRLRSRHGTLRPRDFWRLSFLACWTGGSMGHYLQRLADWWGPVPVRDVGLLASEGRVTLPLADGTPAGVLDVTAGIFEFIPVADLEQPQPATLTPTELEIGAEYGVVLTNTTGLVRYRLDDVVRVQGYRGRSPVLEFLYRGGRVASVAGEKLTENQVVAAVRAACATLRIPEFDFILAPCWADPPFYRLSCPPTVPDNAAAAVDASLAEQNEEYASRRKSARLGPLQRHVIGPTALPELDARLRAVRQSSAEQYKRPCLLTQPGEDEQLLAGRNTV
jgi:hypothetical protein